jgi:uncharacterized membrane protein
MIFAAPYWIGAAVVFFAKYGVTKEAWEQMRFWLAAAFVGAFMFETWRETRRKRNERLK